MQMQMLAGTFSPVVRRNAEVVAGAMAVVAFVVFFGLVVATAALDMARLIGNVVGFASG